MKLLWITLLMTIFINGEALAQKNQQYSAWGRIVHLTKGERLFGYDYYVYLKHEGKEVAYPVKPAGRKNEKLIRSNVNKIARIDGHATLQTVYYGEQKKRILVFTAKKIEPLEMKQLSYSGKVDTSEPRMPVLGPNDRRPERSGISVPNTATNAVILTGGAILAGVVVKHFLERKNQ